MLVQLLIKWIIEQPVKAGSNLEKNNMLITN